MTEPLRDPGIGSFSGLQKGVGNMTLRGEAEVLEKPQLMPSLRPCAFLICQGRPRSVLPDFLDGLDVQDTTLSAFSALCYIRPASRFKSAAYSAVLRFTKFCRFNWLVLPISWKVSSRIADPKWIYYKNRAKLCHIAWLGIFVLMAIHLFPKKWFYLYFHDTR